MHRADGDGHSMMAAIRLRKSGVNSGTIAKAARFSRLRPPRDQGVSQILFLRRPIVSREEPCGALNRLIELTREGNTPRGMA